MYFLKQDGDCKLRSAQKQLKQSRIEICKLKQVAQKLRRMFIVIPDDTGANTNEQTAILNTITIKPFDGRG